MVLFPVERHITQVGWLKLVFAFSLVATCHFTDHSENYVQIELNSRSVQITLVLSIDVAINQKIICGEKMKLWVKLGE